MEGETLLKLACGAIDAVYVEAAALSATGECTSAALLRSSVAVATAIAAACKAQSCARWASQLEALQYLVGALDCCGSSIDDTAHRCETLHAHASTTMRQPPRHPLC